MKIAVIFGGKSAERDVSVASGAQVVNALKGCGHTVIAVDTAMGILSPAEAEGLLASDIRSVPPGADTLAVIRSGMSAFVTSSELADCDVLFLALHGGIGEDGTIQAVLDMAGVPYTGSRHMASVYAMDKDVSKRIVVSAGIPTPDWLMAPVTADEVAAKTGYPVVVKPNKQGSTIGLTVVDAPAHFEAAVNEASHHDNEVMIEAFIPGRELTVGILEDRALAVGEIIPRNSGIFDYESKYQEGGAEEIFPADLSDRITGAVQDLGLRAHRALKLADYSRIDFRLDPEGRLWFLEANSLPGMTVGSLLPKSAAACGIAFPDLCERICRLAVRRHDKAIGQNPVAPG
jgi:D-alanine-D-alanine ligase